MHVLIRFVLPDLALAQRIAQALGDSGHTVKLQPGKDVATAPGDADVYLVLWTVHSAPVEPLRRWAGTVAPLVEVAVAVAPPPRAGTRTWPPVSLAGAGEDLAAVTAGVARAGPVPDRLGGFGGTVDFSDSAETSAGSAGAEPPSSGAEPPAAEPAAAEPPPAAVLLAARAPRVCAPGSSFTASLAAYVEAARASALRRLEQLGEEGDRVAEDLVPDGNAQWRPGAPVTVRAAGPHLSVTPAERRFEWSGRENVAAFAVTVDASAPAGSVQLCFELDVAGVPMAFIPMRLQIGTAAGAAAAPAPAAAVQATLPRTLFASYASKDAALVTQRLSTLARFDPGLDIFQDCNDLTPNAAFSPQLEHEIRTRDAFALFWSRNAAASKWVRWEYELRLSARGMETILPMPLEDVAIAPPPEQFADLHWRDRFLLAGYALAAIREQVVAQQAAAVPKP